MLQKVNGAKVSVMVLACPSYQDIARAMQDCTPVVLETASYANCVKSVGKFELVDIRNLRFTKDGFSFGGSIVGIEVDADPNDDQRSVVYAKSGRAVVVADDRPGGGASIQFIINLSLHVM